MNTKLYFKSLLHLAIIWMLLFLLLKFFFLLFQQIEITNSELAQTILYGIPTDIATILLLMIIPAFCISLYFLYPLKHFRRATYYFILIETAIYSLIAFTETGIYYELKTKINIPYLLHLSHPSEVMRTVSVHLFVIFISGIILCTLLVSTLIKRWIFPQMESVNIKENPGRLRFAAFILFISLIFLIGTEGGVKGSSLSGRSGYFSNNPLLNEATVNPLWGFGVKAMNYKKCLSVNPFVVMDTKEMKQIVESLYAVPKDTTVHFLKTNRPNVVFRSNRQKCCFFLDV